MRAEVVIVGAGFSGTLSAYHLLHASRSHKLRVTLIERTPTLARGLAYSSASPRHILNVPAGNMSAIDGDPDHFLRYCQSRDPSYIPSSFVPRSVYGDYLEGILTGLRAEFEAQQRLRVVRAQVIDVCPDTSSGPNRYQVLLDDGRSVPAQHVILALGHHAPREIGVLDRDLLRSTRYQNNPWEPLAIDPRQSVLLIGTGLTALDVVADLIGRGHQGPIHALSRHGLLPVAHRAQRGTPAPVTWKLPSESTLKQQLRQFRQHVADLEATGADWREALAALRPDTPRAWQALGQSGQSQFLRHLKTHWDNRRHRVAPQPYAVFEQAVATRALTVHSGRIQAGHLDGEQVTLHYRSTDSERLHTLQVGHVLNCTGPEMDVARIEDPLVQTLRARSWLNADSHRIGVTVDANGKLLDEAGAPVPGLHYVGPFLRARDWEATAVPELRVLTRTLATRVLAELQVDAHLTS